MGDYEAAQSGGGSTLGMRIAAGVLLFFASMAGVGPPLLKGPASPDLEHGKAALRMKAFAAGVMLGLAIMHVIADAFADMADLMARRAPLPTLSSKSLQEALTPPPQQRCISLHLCLAPTHTRDPFRSIQSPASSS